jgi:hypothetical protein
MTNIKRCPNDGCNQECAGKQCGICHNKMIRRRQDDVNNRYIARQRDKEDNRYYNRQPEQMYNNRYDDKERNNLYRNYHRT